MIKLGRGRRLDLSLASRVADIAHRVRQLDIDTVEIPRIHPFILVLRQARLDRGMSWKDVGKQLNRSEHTIRAWEEGRRAPNLTWFEQWAEVVGVNITLHRAPWPPVTLHITLPEMGRQ